MRTALYNTTTEGWVYLAVKVELVYRTALMTPQAARVAIAEWIEVFYNRQQRHSTIGFLSPAPFEQQYLNALTLNSSA